MAGLGFQALGQDCASVCVCVCEWRSGLDRGSNPSSSSWRKKGLGCLRRVNAQQTQKAAAGTERVKSMGLISGAAFRMSDRRR